MESLLREAFFMPVKKIKGEAGIGLPFASD